MKKIITFAIVSLLGISSVYAQMDDYDRLSINVIQPACKDIPSEAISLLNSKLKQIITNYGIADNGYNERFIITAKVHVLTKDILPTQPQRISQKLEIVFMIGDVLGNKLYESMTLNVIGVGINETKAYVMAFNNIKTKNERIENFITQAKNKIVAYYQGRGQDILQQAKNLVQKQQYDEAIYSLSVVPNVCGDIYKQCQSLIVEIFKERTNQEGNILLREAQLAWSANPNKVGASKAVSLLQQINILADCSSSIDALIKEINSKIKEDEKKEWEFQLQQYQDRKEKEQRDFEFKVQQYKDKFQQEEKEYADRQRREQRDFEFNKRQHEDEVAITKSLIEASRQVSIEYAKNQPKEVINYNEIIALW